MVSHIRYNNNCDQYLLLFVLCFDILKKRSTRGSFNLLTITYHMTHTGSNIINEFSFSSLIQSMTEFCCWPYHIQGHPWARIVFFFDIECRLLEILTKLLFLWFLLFVPECKKKNGDKSLFVPCNGTVFVWLIHKRAPK